MMKQNVENMLALNTHCFCCCALNLVELGPPHGSHSDQHSLSLDWLLDSLFCLLSSPPLPVIHHNHVGDDHDDQHRHSRHFFSSFFSLNWHQQFEWIAMHANWHSSPWILLVVVGHHHNSCLTVQIGACCPGKEKIHQPHSLAQSSPSSSSPPNGTEQACPFPLHTTFSALNSSILWNLPEAYARMCVGSSLSLCLCEWIMSRTGKYEKWIGKKRKRERQKKSTVQVEEREFGTIFKRSKFIILSLTTFLGSVLILQCHGGRIHGICMAKPPQTTRPNKNKNMLTSTKIPRWIMNLEQGLNVTVLSIKLMLDACTQTEWFSSELNEKTHSKRKRPIPFDPI